MYDQGQVSTSIYYQNDKYGWPKTIRTELGGQVESIKRDKGYIPNSILQLEQVSNDHLASRQLTLSHAIPLPVTAEQQLQQPFRFFVEDMKNMSTQDRVNFVQQGFTFPQQLDGVDDYLITFFDMPNRPTLPRIYPGNTIVSYYRMLYTSLAYLDIYLSEKSPKFATLAQNGSSLQAMMELVRDYYRVCMDMEREYLKDDKCESVFTLLNLYQQLGSPSTNYVGINRKLKVVFDDCASQQLTRTSAYFVFRLLPRIPAVPLIDHGLIQKIMDLLVPVFTQPRGPGFIPNDPMEAEENEVTDEELLMARFDNQLQEQARKAAEQEQYNRVRLQWLLKNNHKGFNNNDRKLLEEYGLANMDVDKTETDAPLQGPLPDDAPSEISDEEAQQRLDALKAEPETSAQEPDRDQQLQEFMDAQNQAVQDDLAHQAAWVEEQKDMEEKKDEADRPMEVDNKLPKTKEQKEMDELNKRMKEKTNAYNQDQRGYRVLRMDPPIMKGKSILYPINFDLVELQNGQDLLNGLRRHTVRTDKSKTLNLQTEVYARLLKKAGKGLYTRRKAQLFSFPSASPADVERLVSVYSENAEFMNSLVDVDLRNEKDLAAFQEYLETNIDINLRPYQAPDLSEFKDKAQKRGREDDAYDPEDLNLRTRFPKIPVAYRPKRKLNDITPEPQPKPLV